MKICAWLVGIMLLSTGVFAGTEIKVCFCKDIDIVFKHENAPLNCSENSKGLKLETFKELYAAGWRLIEATKSGETALLYFERTSDKTTPSTGPKGEGRP